MGRFRKKEAKIFLYPVGNEYLCSPKYQNVINLLIINTMTKAEIVKSIALQTGIQPKEVATVVEAFMEEIRKSLADNKENVFLRGFGSYIVKHRAKKTARNISKNTTLVIDAHDLPAFKPCKSFIERMDRH